MGEERDQVLHALAQRWDADREHVQAVEQVLAEAFLADHAAQIAVGGRDHAHVGLEHTLVADAPEARLLEHAQQAGLELERHVADLVQEQRAALGQFEGAAAVAMGPGEGAAHVPEQLALDELGRNRAAIHHLERSARAFAQLVNRARRELLARARLADEHDRKVGARDRRQILAGREQSLALADHGLERRVSGAQRLDRGARAARRGRGARSLAAGPRRARAQGLCGERGERIEQGVRIAVFRALHEALSEDQHREQAVRIRTRHADRRVEALDQPVAHAAQGARRGVAREREGALAQHPLARRGGQGKRLDARRPLVAGGVEQPITPALIGGEHRARAHAQRAHAREHDAGRDLRAIAGADQRTRGLVERRELGDAALRIVVMGLGVRGIVGHGRHG